MKGLALILCLAALVLTAAVLIADPATALYKKTRVFVLVPPEQILPGVKKIAVLDFTGEGADGHSFADAVTSRLFEKQRGIQDIKTGGMFGVGSHMQEGKTLQQGAFTDVFALIERSRLAQVLQEQRLGQAGVLDEAQAAQVGKVLGVDAIVVGTVSFSVTDQQVREEHTYTQNKHQYTRTVSCVNREGLMKARIRIVSAQSGQVLGSVDRPLPVKSKHCDDEQGGLPTEQSVAEESGRALADAVANYLAPHFELREFELEKIHNKQFEVMGERAAELAEALRVDEAYAIYKSIHDQDPYSPEVMINLAILNEVVGNWSQAKGFYENAFQLKKEDDSKRGLDRMTKNLSFGDALAQLGVVIQEHTFAAGAEDVARATANVVEIRGGGEDRIPIRAQANDQGAVVVSVPGGVTFQLVREEGNWFRIKLLDGKEGYVQKDKAKLRQQ
jgi:tetratricopeptide (TPR) repeat protein